MSSLLKPGAQRSLLPAGQGAPSFAQQPAATADPFQLDAAAQKEFDALQQRDAEDQARIDNQRRLESEYGALGAVGTNFAKGVVDAVMAPAALAAAGLEGVGSFIDSKGLEDFGRDLGRSANAEELFSTASAVPGAVSSLFGGDVSTEQRKQDLEGYDHVKHYLHEQHEAWPMLSTVSHIAGFVGADLAMGGLAATPGAGMAVGTAALGGAQSGAQSAYQQNAPLRDVLASAAIGAALGGGIAAGAHKLVHGIEHAVHARASAKAKLANVFGEATVERAGGKEAQQVIGAMQKELDGLRKTVDKIQNPVARAEAETAAKAAAAEGLARKAASFDPSGWASKPPNAIQKVFRRTEILDQVANDVSSQAGKLSAARPQLSAALNLKQIAKLTKDADAPAAIGALQSRVASALKELPTTADDAIVAALRGSEARLAAAKLPEAMADAHALSGALRELAGQATDKTTKAYLGRVAAGLRQDLGSEVFGSAGRLYRTASALPSKAATGLADPAMLRAALRDTGYRGQLSSVVRRETDALTSAFDAEAKLTGVAAPKGMADELRRLEILTDKAEDAITLDGGPTGRVIDWFRQRAESKATGMLENAIGGAVGGMIGGYPGAALGTLVGSFVSKRLGTALKAVKFSAGHAGGSALESGATKLLGKTAESASSEVARGKAIGGYLSAASRPTDRGEQLEQYQQRFEALQEVALNHEHEGVSQAIQAVGRIAPGIEGAAAADLAQKFGQLLQDMPKPGRTIRGPAFDSMSSQDVRIARAMWEATVEPMSVFDDFAAGDLDPDKVAYAWKQYPGLKLASQAALGDILYSQMDDDSRGEIPESVLTQLDNLFGMEGAIQETRKPAFVAAIDRAAQQMAQQAKQQKRAPLELPTSQPTPMQRIAGQRA